MINMSEESKDLFKNLSFNLPDELIAKYPIHPPDACRLMYIDKKNNTIEEHKFSNLAGLLKPGDLIVANATGVEARRIFLRRQNAGKREQGARIEAVFLDKLNNKENYWKVLIKKRKRLNNGELLAAEKNLDIKFEVIKDDHEKLYLKSPVKLNAADFQNLGQMPIPPYLKREEEAVDRKSYQNYFMKTYGSAAAPTAALHFTDSLVEKLKEKKIQIDYLTLHIGYGTFAPLKKENFVHKSLHKEYYEMPETLAQKLASKDYNRLIALGTTSLRALEHLHRSSGGKFNEKLTGETSIFLYPPDKIESVDGLVTNFHLPQSSLLLLTACMAGSDLLTQAYKKAINEKFRFYSYGDAMLIFK